VSGHIEVLVVPVCILRHSTLLFDLEEPAAGARVSISTAVTPLAGSSVGAADTAARMLVRATVNLGKCIVFELVDGIS
jgi:hypothetical protein